MKYDDKIHFHHVMVVSRSLDSANCVTWSLMDNPGRHDTNHVTNSISKSIGSLRSYRKDVSASRSIAKSAIMLWNGIHASCGSFLLRDINFPFHGNSNQFTIHAASIYAQPRAVVIRAANQKLSSEQPTGCPSMQQAETSTHSLKRGWTVGKYRRNRYTGRRGWDEWEDVRNVLGGCWLVVSFVDVSSSFCSVAHTCVYTTLYT